VGKGSLIPPHQLGETLARRSTRRIEFARHGPAEIRTERSDEVRGRWNGRRDARPHVPPFGKSADSKRRSDRPSLPGSRGAAFDQRWSFLHAAEYARRAVWGMSGSLHSVFAASDRQPERLQCQFANRGEPVMASRTPSKRNRPLGERWNRANRESGASRYADSDGIRRDGSAKCRAGPVASRDLHPGPGCARAGARGIVRRQGNFRTTPTRALRPRAMNLQPGGET
jgi:hypothetical protein